MGFGSILALNCKNDPRNILALCRLPTVLDVPYERMVRRPIYYVGVLELLEPQSYLPWKRKETGVFVLQPIEDACGQDAGEALLT